MALINNENKNPGMMHDNERKREDGNNNEGWSLIVAGAAAESIVDRGSQCGVTGA